MSLLTSLQIKHVAFRWDGTTRVYEATRLWVDGEEEGEDYIIDQRREWTDEGVWLYFQIESNHFRRISPSGFTGNDWIDILNALKDPSIPVQFYPIWDHDNAINYQVKKMPGRVNLVETDRTLFSPKTAISMAVVEKVDDFPLWARTTRTK